jgi:elongation factor Ts
VRRWEKLTVDGPGKVGSYVHMGGKIAVLLAIRTGNDAAVKNASFDKFVDDTAMQVAAMAPLYVDASQVPEDAKKKQAEIFEAQLAEEGKPEKARPKIIEGKIAKWLKEACLIEQQSVLDSEKTVEQIQAALGKEIGADVSLVRFVRFERGEGIEKPVGDDFAAEVAKMAGS